MPVPVYPRGVIHPQVPVLLRGAAWTGLAALPAVGLGLWRGPPGWTALGAVGVAVGVQVLGAPRLAPLAALAWALPEPPGREAALLPWAVGLWLYTLGRGALGWGVAAGLLLGGLALERPLALAAWALFAGPVVVLQVRQRRYRAAWRGVTVPLGAAWLALLLPWAPGLALEVPVGELWAPGLGMALLLALPGAWRARRDLALPLGWLLGGAFAALGPGRWLLDLGSLGLGLAALAGAVGSALALAPVQEQAERAGPAERREQPGLPGPSGDGAL